MAAPEDVGLKRNVYLVSHGERIPVGTKFCLGAMRVDDDGATYNLYEVGADNTVAQKYITLGQVVDDGLRVIKDGLTADDRVVVNGLMRARAGAKVTPQEQTPPAPPSSAPAEPAADPQKKN